MTEQPVETEQQFLGNVTPLAGFLAKVEEFLDTPVFGPLPPAPLQHYAPNAHRLPVSNLAVADANFQRKVEGQRIPLDLQAELHAGNAVQSFQNGELDEGIAWLQSALAFAQNHRHTLAEETAR